MAHTFQVFKYCWYFLIVFSSRHCLYTKGGFFIKYWKLLIKCFGGVVVAIDTVLRSPKGKILLRINKSCLQNFPRYESKCSDQNTNVVRFHPWNVAIPYFSRANDRIEIDNFYCLVSSSKRLYKWKSLGAGSNGSNIAVSIINTKWQLFNID